MKFGQTPPHAAPAIHSNALDPRSVELLAAHAGRLDTPVIRLGLPVWGDKEWVGSVYPPKTPAKSFLKAYAAQFQAIELNATFYKNPDLHVVERWVGEVGPEFKFVPKWPRRISHEFQMPNWNTAAFFEWAESLKAFGPKLGISFLQLPPSTAKNLWPRLKSLLKQTHASHLPTAIEFRHVSWFTSDQCVQPDVLEGLAEFGIHLVISDTVGRSDVAHRSLTSPKLMVRFLGTNLGAEEATRLTEWGIKLKDWAQYGLEEVYFFCHEPENVLSPQLHTKVVTQWKSERGWKLPAWTPYAPAPDLFSAASRTS